MRIVIYLSNKSNIFGMGYLFNWIDHHLLENSKIDKLNKFYQLIIVFFIVFPCLLIGIGILGFIMIMSRFEVLLFKLIFRNIIKITIPKDLEKKKQLINNLKNDFNYRINYNNIELNNGADLYFYKESDLAFFILKYSEYIK